MLVRNRASLVGLALCVLAAPSARALDKDAKKWLDEVKPIMLPDEEKTYRDLRTRAKGGRVPEDLLGPPRPRPDTPANEYQAEYEKERADADMRYRIGGTPGSQTDCGRVYVLLGKPDDVKKAESGDASLPVAACRRRGPTATARASSSAPPGRSSSASTRAASSRWATAWAISSTAWRKRRW